MNGEVLVTYALSRPGSEVIKLEYSLRLKIKRKDWLIIALYFEFENELKFYNLEACRLL